MQNTWASHNFFSYMSVIWWTSEASWYLDLVFVKAILICLIYGNPDRVWSCLREARGDQDGMVGCQSLSSSSSFLRFWSLP